MHATLVVGATGQLGFAVVKRLLARRIPVRAMVRSDESARRLAALGAEPVLADLTDPASLRTACSGISVVVATANAAVPSRASDTFEAVERDGYRNLIDAAKASGISRLVYTSAPVSRHDQSSAFLRYKRQTEEYLIRSGLDHVIFRAAIFMDISFTMMGSMVPVKGAEMATVLRPFPFVARHLKRIDGSIEKKRVAMIPGDGRTRHSFICIDDVANLLAAAAAGGSSGTFDAGGPQALSFLDIVQIYEKLLGVKLQVKRTPAWVFRLLASGLVPFTRAGANLMFLNYIAASGDSAMASAPATAATFGVSLTTAEAFLRNQCSAAAD
jgi:uncharacterized protein YbjT (DUF2867 family)